MTGQPRIKRSWFFDNRDLETLGIIDFYEDSRIPTHVHITKIQSITESSRAKVIRRLQDMGLIKIDRFVGRAVKYNLTPTGKSLLVVGNKIKSYVDKETNHEIDSDRQG
jgi:chromosome segregation and condensation protein ScpB